MKHPVVVISAVGGDIGMGVAKALRESVGTVIGTDCRSIRDPENTLDAFYQVPVADEQAAFLDTILELLDRARADFFVPVSEPEILLVAKHRSAFEAVSAIPVVNSQFVVETFTDKYATAKFLEHQGLPRPETVPLKGFNGSFDYPLIVKSRHGCGSKSVWLVKDSFELELLRKKGDDSLIVQECIGTAEKEYTTGIFSDGKKVESISFRRKLGFGGLSVEVELVNAPALEDIARRTAAAAGLVGSINLQSRLRGDEFIPFEINPRLSSTLLFRKKFGFNDALWWLQILQGKDFQYSRKYRSGKAVRRLKEFYFDLE